MKYADVEKLHEAGLINDDQRQKIISHFSLKEEGNKFLAIISFIGAVLVISGVVLLVASNWQEIPRAVKIGVGMLLMLGAHAGGWYLREVQQVYRKSGEALHLVGSGLFLANIALIGQIYHIATREPNAFLLWWVGIAALPWLLRSKAQHVLLLLAFGIWFGFEVNENNSPIYFRSDENQILLYALLGLIFVGAGYCLRRTRFAEFASPTEKFGLLGFQTFAYPMTWGIFGHHGYAWYDESRNVSQWILPALCGVAVLSVVFGAGGLKDLTRQWRWIWGLALAGAVGLLAGAYYWAPIWDTAMFSDRHNFGYHWIAAIGLFVFCLLEIQTGIQERSPFMINSGVVFIALDIFAMYFVLFGSMARTGVMFLLSGIFLIAFGIYLEKKRRSLMKQIRMAT